MEIVYLQKPKTVQVAAAWQECQVLTLLQLQIHKYALYLVTFKFQLHAIIPVLVVV